MLLGALVDLGLPLDALRAELAKLPLAGYRARGAPRRSLRAPRHQGRRASTRARPHRVITSSRPRPRADHAHAHRGLREILELLERQLARRRDRGTARVRSSGAWPRPRRRSTARRPRSVHFHEVGAVDSIVDIVGGVIGLAWLRADRFVASPLNVGTRHGHDVPRHVPGAAAGHRAPRQGRAGLRRAGEGELLTPTGALLVTGYAIGLRPAAVAAARGHRPRRRLARHARAGPTCSA